MQLKDTKKNYVSDFNKFAKYVRKIANYEIKIQENLFKRSIYEHIDEVHMLYNMIVWQNFEDLNYKKIIEEFL